MSWRHRSGRGLQRVWCSRGKCQIRCRSVVHDGQWWCGWRCWHSVASLSHIAPRGSRQWQVWTERGRCLVYGSGLVIEVVSVEVFVNCMAWWSGNHRDVHPEKLPILECHSPRAINSDHVLVELADLNDGACLVPFVGVRASLVLNTYAITHDQSWQMFRVLGPVLGSTHMPVPQCFFSGGEGVSPGIVRFVSTGQYRDEVFDRSSEYARGQR